MIKDTLETKIIYRIKRSKTSVFTRKDFCGLSDTDQIGRVLLNLVKSNILIRLGYGVYARTKKSLLNNTPILEKPLPELALDILKKLGVTVCETEEQILYNSGQSTQVPTGRKIAVKGRFSRKIEYNGQSIYFV